MKYFMFSVVDKATGIHDNPFCAHSDAQAVRSFKDAANADEGPISQHPEDFFLVRLGTFNNASGGLEPEVPECVCTGLQAISGDVVGKGAPIDNEYEERTSELQVVNGEEAVQ
jgi:hypothetical protein